MGMDAFILTDTRQDNLAVTKKYLAYWRGNYALDELMAGIFYQRGGHGNRNNLPMCITIENLRWLRDRLTDDDVAYCDMSSSIERCDFFQRMEETIKSGIVIYYYVAY